MTWTASTLQARFPAALGALSTASGGPLDSAIADAYALNNATTLGADYERAVAYHAAHLALVDRRAASDGIASATADGVSTSFDHSSQANTFWEEYQKIVGRRSMSGVLISNFAGWGL